MDACMQPASIIICKYLSRKVLNRWRYEYSYVQVYVLVYILEYRYSIIVQYNMLLKSTLRAAGPFAIFRRLLCSMPGIPHSSTRVLWHADIHGLVMCDVQAWMWRSCPKCPAQFDQLAVADTILVFMLSRISLYNSEWQSAPAIPTWENNPDPHLAHESVRCGDTSSCKFSRCCLFVCLFDCLLLLLFSSLSFCRRLRRRC